MGKKENSQNLIELLLFNNIIPIILTVVAIIIFTIRLEGRVDLIDQKLNLLVQQQQEIINTLDKRLSSVENIQNNEVSRLAILETKINK